MIEYQRNPFRGMPDKTEEEKAWDILYERYQSQQDHDISDKNYVFLIPTMDDAIKYVRYHNEFRTMIKSIQATTCTIYDKLLNARIVTLIFENKVNGLASKITQGEIYEKTK